MVKTRRNRKTGGGYQTSQQFFNPGVLPPNVPAVPIMSTGPTDVAIRPVLSSTFQLQKGGGYQTSQQFFNADVLPPHVPVLPILSTAPTDTAIRPVLASTFKVGGGTRRRRDRKGRQARFGGFTPSVMGPFIANAQAAVVPLAFYGVYHTMVKKNTGSSNKSSTRKVRSKKSRN